MKEKAERQTAKSFFIAAVCPLLSRGEEKETDFGDGRKSFKILLYSSPHHSPIASETPYTRAIPED